MLTGWFLVKSRGNIYHTQYVTNSILLVFVVCFSFGVSSKTWQPQRGNGGEFNKGTIDINLRENKNSEEWCFPGLVIVGNYHPGLKREKRGEVNGIWKEYQ